MPEDQDPGRLLLLRVRPARVQTQPRGQCGQDGTVHDLRHEEGQTEHRCSGGHEDRRPHRQRPLWGHWTEEVAVRRVERRRDHRQHHGADGSARVGGETCQ